MRPEEHNQSHRQASSSVSSSTQSLQPHTSSNDSTTKPSLRHAEKKRTSTCLFADSVARVCIDAYRARVRRRDNQQHDEALEAIAPTCLACIVARVEASIDESSDSFGSSSEQPSLFVVGLGVGTKFLSESLLRGEAQADPYGNRVRDCHAEVLARRAFRRYLSLEILADLGAKPCVDDTRIPCLLERCSHYSVSQAPQLLQYRLRSNVTLHMYSSSCPCGNATIKRFATLRREIFRGDLERHQWPLERHPSILPAHSTHLGQLALLVKRNQVATTPLHASLQQQPVATGTAETWCRLSARERKWIAHTTTDWCPPGTTTVWSHQGSLHTCSDKIARWNALGLQGSLLASVLHPSSAFLVPDTITVGRKFSAATCRRAFCCRVANDEKEEPVQPHSGTANGTKTIASLASHSNISKISMHHPSILGTSVCLNEGAVETSLATVGQDVRFHSSRCYAWWPGLDEAECIDGSTGFATPAIENVAGGAAPERSLVSTAALTELFLQLQSLRRKDEAPANVTTLRDLRALKQRVSVDYEQIKTELLTHHPTFKLWTRRCP